MCNSVFERLKDTGNIPTPPGVVLQVLQIAQSPDASIHEIAQVIGLDPALSAKLLRFVNSPMAGVAHEVRSIQHAVSLLGVWGTTVLALSFAVLSSEQGEQCEGFDEQEYQVQSLACGVSAKALASITNSVPPDDAFAVGLLSQIGRTVFASGLPREYANVLAQAQRIPADLPALEREMIGSDYPTIGAKVLADWGICKTIWEPIAGLRSPDSSSEFGAMARILHVSELAAEIVCAKEGLQDALVDEYLDTAHRLLRGDVSEFVSILGTISAELEQAMACLDLPPQSYRPIDEIEQEVRARKSQMVDSIGAAMRATGVSDLMGEKRAAHKS